MLVRWLWLLRFAEGVEITGICGAADRPQNQKGTEDGYWTFLSSHNHNDFFDKAIKKKLSPAIMQPTLQTSTAQE